LGRFSCGIVFYVRVQAASARYRTKPAEFFFPLFSLLPDRGVALAGGIFQAAAVVDPDAPAIVSDEAGFLQNARGDSDAGAPSSEHVREEFLREGYDVSAEPILAHQEPTSEAFVHFMKTVAGTDVGGLHSHALRVTVQFFFQCRRVRQHLFEVCRGHLVCAAADLHDNLRWAAAESDDERESDESFLARQANFDAFSVRHDTEHRSKTAIDEVGVRERLTSFMQHGVGRQLHEFDFPADGAQFVGGQAEQDQIQNAIAVAIGSAGGAAVNTTR